MLVEAQHVRQVLQTASADFQGALTSLSSQREHPEHVATVLQLLSSGLVPQAWVPDGMTGQSSGLLQSGEAPTLLAWRTTIQVSSRCSAAAACSYLQPLALRVRAMARAPGPARFSWRAHSG